MTAKAIVGDFDADTQGNYLADHDVSEDVPWNSFEDFIAIFKAQAKSGELDDSRFTSAWETLSALSRTEDPTFFDDRALNRANAQDAALKATLFPDTHPGIPIRAITLRIETQHPDAHVPEPAWAQTLLMRILSLLDGLETSPLYQWFQAHGTWDMVPQDTDIEYVLNWVFLSGIEELEREDFEIDDGKEAWTATRATFKVMVIASMLQTPDMTTERAVPSLAFAGHAEHYYELIDNALVHAEACTNDAERTVMLDQLILQQSLFTGSQWKRMAIWPALMTLVADMTDASEALPRIKHLTGWWGGLEKSLPNGFVANGHSPSGRRLRERFFSGEPDPLDPFYETVELSFLDQEDARLPDQINHDNGWFVAFPKAHKVTMLTLDQVSRRILPQCISVLRAPLQSVEILTVGRWSPKPFASNADVIEAMEAIANNPTLANLSGLYLTDMCIGNDGLAVLAASPHLRSVSTLGLGGGEREEGNRITRDGIRALAASPMLASVAHLELSWNESIWLDDIERLFNAPHLTSLVSLGLALTGVKKSEVLELIQGFPHLANLDISF